MTPGDRALSQPHPFDKIARDYRDLWDNSDVGRLQREAVWSRIQPLFRTGDTILDLGCGTGDDALRLARHGVTVVAIDASSEMVRIARERGVDARICRIEDIESLPSIFDGAFSNFGAMNCVEDLAALREPLARRIAPGGYLALCVIGRFCLWETVWYLLRGDIRKAIRRWKGSAQSSLGLKVFYPTVREIKHSLSPEFTLQQAAGIGVAVPPSFVRGLPFPLLRVLDWIDQRIAAWPPFALVADHRLLVLRRV
jgi:ubiquinone/menaquinone biosynthesis C-methylase UbiE